MKAKVSLLIILVAVAAGLWWAEWRRATARAELRRAGWAYWGTVCTGGGYERETRRMQYEDARDRAEAVLGYEEPDLGYFDAAIFSRSMWCASGGDPKVAKAAVRALLRQSRRK